MRLIFIVLCLILGQGAYARGFDYKLDKHVTQIAEDSFVVKGELAHFSRQNGGNIVNTAFIITEEGVVVIDTGPSFAYGQALRALIEATTDQPIVAVYNTHQHPDHFFGNQAFTDIPQYALAKTIDNATHESNGYSDNLYRLIGPAMFGTEPVFPERRIASEEVSYGDRTLTLLAMSGHSAADLVIIDQKTHIMYAGDIAFFNRAPTTPHAHINTWIAALNTLAARSDWQQAVPGHGPAVIEKTQLSQTKDYLVWLDEMLYGAAEEGQDMAALMYRDIPPVWQKLAVMPDELQRSIVHLYPEIEAATLREPDFLERK